MKNLFRATLLVSLALVATSCGSSEGETSLQAVETTVETASEAVTSGIAPSSDDVSTSEEGDGAATSTEVVEIEALFPKAIISLSPTATEMLYAIGAGDQVLAVDDFSNFPAVAADKMPGISGYDPNVEAIIGLGSDLIITDGTNPDLLDALDRAGIPHWEGPAAVGIGDTFTQIRELGEATGHIDEAEALVAQLQDDLEALLDRIDSLPAIETPLTYYHELDNTYYSVTSETFIGSTYSLLGLRNIADLAEDQSYGYPQLSAEFILDKDPDIIFLACTLYCGETPESVSARPGWDVLSAVANGHVVPLNDDIASRWGPRTVEHMAAVVGAVEAVVAAGESD